MAVSDLYLAIDCGGTTIKAGVYDTACQELGSARRTLNLISIKPGYAERDMCELTAFCIEVICEAVKKSGVDTSRIKAVAITAQGKGLYPVDKDGNPVQHGILSADRRAIDVVKAWQGEHILEKIYPKTRQTLWTGHPVSILRYLKDFEPQRYEAIDSIFMPHDYLRFCLTGAKALEVTNISESNLYNMNTDSFDPELAQILGIEECMDKLPKIAGSTEICGTITEEIAQKTSLKAGTPVVGGLFDVVSVVMSAGLKDESAINASMGTWAVASAVAKQLDNDEKPYVYGRHIQKHRYVVHEASPTSSGNLEWVCNMLKERDFAKINAMIEPLPKASGDVFFIPFLYGTNASLDATAGFYGLQAIHGQADLFKAAFEGVIFSQVKHLNSIRAKFDKADRIVVTGGPVHSKVWMQMLADCTGLPVYLPQIEETGCLGAALVAQIGTGLYKDLDEAMDALKLKAQCLEPDLKAHPLYLEKFERYNELVSCLDIYNSRVHKHN